ncbi:hypothetical protein VmeM32_00086 [Vibrio phage vB_VmeM-32]|nr:hypothetical protein VmeM32_00086 [Vibrio phage vB_VmeM-32]
MRTITDAIYTYKFIDLLQKPFNQWPAYRHGIIDADGKLLKKPKTNVEKSSYSKFHSMVRQIKRQLTVSVGHNLTKTLAVKTGWDVISEEYDIDLKTVALELNESDENLYQNLMEALTVGDSSDNVINISTGIASGSITKKAPETLQDRIKHKRKKKAEDCEK